MSHGCCLSIMIRTSGGSSGRRTEALHGRRAEGGGRHRQAQGHEMPAAGALLLKLWRGAHQEEAREGGGEGGGEGGQDCEIARSRAMFRDFERFDQAAVGGPQGAAQTAFRGQYKRREDSGRALVLVAPTGEGRHGWFVRKLQTLLKKEFEEGIIHKDADDLKEGDRGLESRADRAPRQSRAQKAAPSDGDEAAASKEAEVISARP